MKKNHDLFKFLKTKGFAQLVDRPTHIGGGLLDQIFVNPSLLKKNPFHSQRCVYYSDHDEIVLHIPRDNIRNQHESSDDDVEIYQCKFCDEEFFTITDKVEHEKKFHSTIHLNAKTILEEQI